jgi:hypothetical protein
MKKVILSAVVFAFAVSTMFAQQSTGTTTPTPAKKPKTEATPAKKDTTKKDGKAPVKKVPSKKKTDTKK